VRRRRWSNNKNPILRIWGIRNIFLPWTMDLRKRDWTSTDDEK